MTISQVFLEALNEPVLVRVLQDRTSRMDGQMDREIGRQTDR